jgi:type I restriction enzyme M protein
MVSMPGQLFYSTPIPVCLWFLTRNKGNGKSRDRRKQTLFIDARKLGTLIDRVHRELSDEEIARISGTYHSWRGDPKVGKYKDIPGFCKSATTKEITAHGFVLTPGRYVGAETDEEDDEPFEQKITRLVCVLKLQFSEARKMDRAIEENLKEFGFDE